MNVHIRQPLSFFDKLLSQIDIGLKVVSGAYHHSQRVNPANEMTEPSLSSQESKHAAGLMRVNHVGEVCAQALYQGQTLTTRSFTIRQTLQRCAEEETDHLVWCQQRLDELHGHTSYLNPAWYAGAYALGMVAGWLGDQWGLGFVSETEHQVINHLEGHFSKLPDQDTKSLAIIKQMKADEAQHAATAKREGATELPFIIKQLMRFSAKVMTTTAYYL